MVHDMEKTAGALSVLCADVSVGARLSRTLDAPEAQYAVRRCEKRLRRSVENYRGRLVEYTGRTVMAFFDESKDALQSAIEMQRRVANLPRYPGLPLAIRVGICAGHQSAETRYFPSAGTNPAISLSAVADPGNILISLPKREKLLPWVSLVAESVPDLQLNCGKRRLGIFQVTWREVKPGVLRTALAQLEDVAERLCLRHLGGEMVLDQNRPVVSLGRQAGCDVTLSDRRCSRAHATIERRLDRFVLVDRSANGTFVTFEGQIEVFVHHQELVLFGRGKLSLGASPSTPGVEVVHFQAGSAS